MRRTTWALGLSVLCWSSLASGQVDVSAPPPPSPEKHQQAQRNLTAGQKLLKRERFEEALGKLLAAYADEASGAALLGIALAQRETDRLPEAYRSYEKLLAERAAELTPDERDRAQRVLAELGAVSGIVTLTVSEPGAAYAVDNRPLDADTLAHPLHLSGGRHVFGVTKPGFEQLVFPIWVTVGKVLEASLALKPAAGAAPPPAAPLSAPAAPPPAPIAPPPPVAPLSAPAAPPPAPIAPPPAPASAPATPAPAPPLPPGPASTAPPPAASPAAPAPAAPAPAAPAPAAPAPAAPPPVPAPSLPPAPAPAAPLPPSPIAPPPMPASPVVPPPPPLAPPPEAAPPTPFPLVPVAPLPAPASVGPPLPEPTHEPAPPPTRDASANANRVGFLLGLVTLPRPIEGELVVKLGSSFALGLKGSFLPELSAPGIDGKIDLKAVEGIARWFPGNGVFFLGAGLGYQSFKASLGEIVDDNELTIGADMSGFFVQPQLGVLWISQSGFAISFGIGVQIPIPKDPVVTASYQGQPVPAQATSTIPPEVVEAANTDKANVQSVARFIVKYPFPTLDLLRIGIFF